MNTTSRLNAYGAKLATLLGSASLLTMANAMAGQDRAYAGEVAAGAAAVGEEIPENVLITGSLIRGTAAVGVPVTNLSPMDFATTGSLTTADLFRTFPQANTIPGPVGTQSGANIERAIKVNIRQLDSGSTVRSLLMVDGVRFPFQGNGLCELDPSIVPAISLDHIDVLVDGASATYGSDAIGGVVNIILRRNFDGAMTQLRYTTRAGGGARYQAAQLWGRTWDGGQVTLSYEWYDETPVMGNAHSMYSPNYSPFGLDNGTNIGSTMPGIISFGSFNTNQGGLSAQIGTSCGYQPFMSAGNGGPTLSQCYAIPRGNASGPSFTQYKNLNAGAGPLTPAQVPNRLNFGTQILGNCAFDSSANQAGGIEPCASNGTRNQFNPYSRAWYDAAGQRNGGALTVDQRLTKDISMFFSGFYSDRRAQFLNPSTLGPVVNDAMVGISVPSWNPYYPQNIPAGNSASGKPYTDLKISYDLGFEYPRLTSAYEVASHYQVGLNIALPAGWEANTYFSQTYDSSASNVNGVVNKNAVSAALGWTLAATAASGSQPGIQSWVKPALVPYLNVFCDASQFTCNSPTTLAYMRGFRQIRERFLIDEKAIKLDGPLFDLPGGTVKAAIGADLTSMHFDFNTQDNTGNQTLILRPTPVGANRSIWAVFTQINIPIFSDMNALPLLRKLELEASWRHDQYDDVGGTSNPKIAFNWSPIDDLTFKGAWGSSFRAPNFGELSPQTNVAVGGFNLASAFNTSNTPITEACGLGAGNAGAPPPGSGGDKMQSVAKAFINSMNTAIPGWSTANVTWTGAPFTSCVRAVNLAPMGSALDPDGVVRAYHNPLNFDSPGGITCNCDYSDVKGLRDPFTNSGIAGYNQITPEKTTNWGIGFDYAPTNILKGLDIQVTYYVVKFTNFLTNFSRTTSAALNDSSIPFAIPTPNDYNNALGCPGQANAVAPGVLIPAELLPYTCATWVGMANSLLANPRNPVNPQASTLIYWINDGGNINRGWRKVDGVDWNWSYDWDMGNIGAFNIGQVGTYYLHDQTQFVPNTPIGDIYHSDICAPGSSGSPNANNTVIPPNSSVCAGLPGSILGVPTLPRMKYRARLGWSNGPWSVTGFMDYTAHYFHTINAPPNVNGFFCAPDGISPGGTSKCKLDHYTNFLPAWYTFDLSIGYDTGDNPANSYLKNITIQMVVQDLLDKHAGFQYRLQATGGNACACEILKPLYGRQISFVISKTW